MARLASSMVFLALAACSGAASTDLFGEGREGSEASGTASGDDGATPGQAPSASGTPAPDPPAPTTDPPPPDDPPPPQPDKDGGAAPCGVSESEPNDALEAADAFGSSFCGKLTSNDVDFAKVTAPGGASTMTFAHKQEAAVNYRIYQNGANYAPNANSISVLPVIAGAVYTFRMTLPQGSGQQPNYKIDVVFQ